MGNEKGAIKVKVKAKGASRERVSVNLINETSVTESRSTLKVERKRKLATTGQGAMIIANMDQAAVSSMKGRKVGRKEKQTPRY